MPAGGGCVARHAMNWRLPLGRYRDSQSDVLSGDLFLVEALTKAKRPIANQSPALLVRWLGYHPVFDTWERAENVVAAEVPSSQSSSLQLPPPSKRKSDSARNRRKRETAAEEAKSAYATHVQLLEWQLELQEALVPLAPHLFTSGLSRGLASLPRDVIEHVKSSVLSKRALKALSGLGIDLSVDEFGRPRRAQSTAAGSESNICSRDFYRCTPALHVNLACLWGKRPSSGGWASGGRLTSPGPERPANSPLYTGTTARLSATDNKASDSYREDLLTWPSREERQRTDVSFSSHSGTERAPPIRRGHAVVDLFRVCCMPPHPLQGLLQVRQPIRARVGDPTTIKRLWVPKELSRSCSKKLRIPSCSSSVGLLVPRRLRQLWLADQTRIVYEIEWKRGFSDTAGPRSLLNQGLVDSIYPWLRRRFGMKADFRKLIDCVPVSFIILLPAPLWHSITGPTCGADCVHTSRYKLAPAVPDIIEWWQRNVKALRVRTMLRPDTTDCTHNAVALTGPAGLAAEFLSQLWRTAAYLLHNCLHLVEPKCVSFVIIPPRTRKILGSPWSVLRRITIQLGCTLTAEDVEALDKSASVLSASAARGQIISEVAAWPAWDEFGALSPAQVENSTLLPEHLKLFRFAQGAKIGDPLVPEEPTPADRFFSAAGGRFPLAFNATPTVQQVLCVALIDEIAFATFLSQNLDYNAGEPPHFQQPPPSKSPFSAESGASYSSMVDQAIAAELSPPTIPFVNRQVRFISSSLMTRHSTAPPAAFCSLVFPPLGKRPVPVAKPPPPTDRMPSYTMRFFDNSSARLCWESPAGGGAERSNTEEAADVMSLPAAAADSPVKCYIGGELSTRPPMKSVRSLPHSISSDERDDSFVSPVSLELIEPTDPPRPAAGDALVVLAITESSMGEGPLASPGNAGGSTSFEWNHSDEEGDDDEKMSMEIQVISDNDEEDNSKNTADSPTKNGGGNQSSSSRSNRLFASPWAVHGALYPVTRVSLSSMLADMSPPSSPTAGIPAATTSTAPASTASPAPAVAVRPYRRSSRVLLSRHRTVAAGTALWEDILADATLTGKLPADLVLNKHISKEEAPPGDVWSQEVLETKLHEIQNYAKRVVVRQRSGSVCSDTRGDEEDHSSLSPVVIISDDDVPLSAIRGAVASGASASVTPAPHKPHQTLPALAKGSEEDSFTKPYPAPSSLKKRPLPSTSPGPPSKRMASPTRSVLTGNGSTALVPPPHTTHDDELVTEAAATAPSAEVWKKVVASPPPPRLAPSMYPDPSEQTQGWSDSPFCLLQDYLRQLVELFRLATCLDLSVSEITTLIEDGLEDRLDLLSSAAATVSEDGDIRTCAALAASRLLQVLTQLKEPLVADIFRACSARLERVNVAELRRDRWSDHTGYRGRRAAAASTSGAVVVVRTNRPGTPIALECARSSEADAVSPFEIHPASDVFAIEQRLLAQMDDLLDTLTPDLTQVCNLSVGTAACFTVAETVRDYPASLLVDPRPRHPEDLEMRKKLFPPHFHHLLEDISFDVLENRLALWNRTLQSKTRSLC